MFAATDLLKLQYIGKDPHCFHLLWMGDKPPIGPLAPIGTLNLDKSVCRRINSFPYVFNTLCLDAQVCDFVKNSYVRDMMGGTCSMTDFLSIFSFSLMMHGVDLTPKELAYMIYKEVKQAILNTRWQKT